MNIDSKSSYRAVGDYAQSANSIFNFMKESRFLEKILKEKVIIPRYCRENIEYLGLEANGIIFKEVLVLQKCFCDIPLSKIFHHFKIEEYNLEGLTEEEKKDVKDDFTHTTFYGEYGIAFSKEWGEKKQLQPVQYLNENSDTIKTIKTIFKNLYEKDNPEDVLVDGILNRISYIKPLRGTMVRKIQKKNIEYIKNFHDEQEWRYVPTLEKMKDCQLEPVYANPNACKAEVLDILNDTIENEVYENLRIQFDYNEIKYIVVPNSYERDRYIKLIMNIDDNNFSLQDVELEKQRLISKILVLEEIRGDT